MYIADEFGFGETGFELDWRGRRRPLLVRGSGSGIRCCRLKWLQQRKGQLMVKVGLAMGSLSFQTEKSFLDEPEGRSQGSLSAGAVSQNQRARSPKQVERSWTRVYARCMHDDRAYMLFATRSSIMFIIESGSGCRPDQNTFSSARVNYNALPPTRLSNSLDPIMLVSITDPMPVSSTFNPTLLKKKTILAEPHPLHFVCHL